MDTPIIRSIKRFARKILFFSGITLFVVMIASVILIRFNKAEYQILYLYQLQKLKNQDQINTLFIGDSSLGNAIDGEEFTKLSGKPALNIALTGLYGYAGSYNMLKIALREHPEIKNVVLMQTIDMQTRQVSFAGYVRTSQRLSDFIELTPSEKFLFLKEMLLYVKSVQLSDLVYDGESIVENDYVIQSNKRAEISPLLAITPESLNTQKEDFLARIVKYSHNKGVNLIYVHGPVFEDLRNNSINYIEEANNQIASTNILLLPDIVTMNKDELGDSYDHIKPELKKKFTARYYELLQKNLQ